MEEFRKMIIDDYHLSSHYHSPSPPLVIYSHYFTELFEILNINPTSNKRKVTVYFRTLARIFHPDKYYDKIKEFTRKEGEEKFKQLSNAYEDLKNSNTFFDEAKFIMTLIYLLFVAIRLNI